MSIPSNAPQKTIEAVDSTSYKKESPKLLEKAGNVVTELQILALERVNAKEDLLENRPALRFQAEKKTSGKYLTESISNTDFSLITKARDEMAAT